MRYPCVFVVVATCTRAEPPSWDAAATANRASHLPPRDAYSEPPKDAAGEAASDAASAADPGTLPQTRAKPEASGAAFDARVAALWEAIASDDPERALPFFFPRDAYVQVKGIQNPAADWKRRLVGAYSRDIHELHVTLGKSAKSARFVRFDAGPAPRWVEPGEEYNKIGYYRVFGSKVRFEHADGRSDAFAVKSLISWRGEWYVVHLSGFK